MRMDGRRTSSNVDDRRGMSAGKAAGMGIGGIIIIVLISWIMGANPLSVIQDAANNGGLLTGGGVETSQDYQPTAEEEALAEFSKQILASTEDVWSKIFREQVGAECIDSGTLGCSVLRQYCLPAFKVWTVDK